MTTIGDQKVDELAGGGRTLLGWPRPANHAVTNVALSLLRGQTLGIVGESGCGKSTLARMLAGLTLPSAGTVSINGRVFGGGGNAPLSMERRAIQYVFQDPFGSLNPRHRIYDILEAPLARLARLDRKRRGERLVETVVIDDRRRQISMLHRRRGEHGNERAPRAADRKSPDADEAQVFLVPGEQRANVLIRIGLSRQPHQSRVHEDIRALGAADQIVPIGLDVRKPRSARDLDRDR